MNVLEEGRRSGMEYSFWHGVFFGGVVLLVGTLTFIGVLTVIGWAT